MNSIKEHFALKNISNIFVNILPYVLILFFYVLFLQISISPSLIELFSDKYSFPLIFGLFALIISFRLPPRFEKWISLILILVLFSIPLIYAWNTANTHLGRLGGLIPGSDAGVYLRISESLLDGQRINLGWKRPLFSGFLSFLLWLTQRNILIIQAILAGLVAISFFILSRELKRSYGNLAAAVTIAGACWYWSGSAGTLMSEGLGMTLGALSFTLLLRGGIDRQKWLVLAGLALLMVGLCARMGPLPIALFVVVWGGILLRENRLFSWSFGIIGTLLIYLFLSLNSHLSNYVSNGLYESFGNYAFVLYGLLTNGTWETIYADHPEITKFAKGDQIALIYQYISEILARDPMAFVRGISRAFSVMFNQGTFILLGAGIEGLVTSRTITIVLVRPLLLVGLIACAWRSRFFLKPNCKPPTVAASLLFIFILGTVLTAPLAPVWDSGLRPYATTIMSVYALLGVGLAAVVTVITNLPVYQCFCSYISSLFARSNRESIPSADEDHSETRYYSSPNQKIATSSIALALGILISAISFLWPYYIKSTTPVWVASKQRCAPPLERMEVYINPASVLYLHPNNELAQTKVPHLRLGDFKKILTTFSKQRNNRFGFFQDIAKRLKPNTVILASTGGSAFPILRTSFLPKKPGHYVICFEREYFSGPESRAPIRFALLDIKKIFERK